MCSDTYMSVHACLAVTKEDYVNLVNSAECLPIFANIGIYCSMLLDIAEVCRILRIICDLATLPCFSLSGLHDGGMERSGRVEQNGQGMIQ